VKVPGRITINAKGEATVRGLPIWALTVYRQLAFFGLAESEVLAKYPGLEPEDLAAVRVYAVYVVKSRTHDEVTGRRLLSKKELIHGRYYKGRANNTTLARWHEGRSYFLHWRDKLGHVFIDTLRYPTDEDEPWWDTFNVVEEVPYPPVEIPFDEEAEFHGNPELLTVYDEEVWQTYLFTGSEPNHVRCCPGADATA
jgi:uncharacterized protein (DUF433 family)